MQLHLEEREGLETYINKILIKSYKIKSKVNFTHVTL